MRIVTEFKAVIENWWSIWAWAMGAGITADCLLAGMVASEAMQKLAARLIAGWAAQRNNDDAR